MPPTLRPMTTDDAPAVAQLTFECFAELDARFGRPPTWGADLTTTYPRFRHLATTDPDGSWVAEQDGELRGAALALVREGLWGLSLLVVSPAHQSGGIGRSLLQNTLDYGRDAAAGLILASEDARALRSYSRAGFDLRPAVDAKGPVRHRPDPEPSVRAARWTEDREIVDAAGRFVRGAGHGVDVPVWLEMGCQIYVHADGGFAVRQKAELKCLAAHDEAAAASLLRAVLRDAPEGEGAEVGFITGGQEWAVRTVLDAGLALSPGGAVMVRGESGPLAPYIPSGSYV